MPAPTWRARSPKPTSASREALYGYLLGKPHDVLALPGLVTAFEAFKRDRALPVPNVPFQMLTALPLTKEHWVAIAETAGWQMLRQNLNTFARHGVFDTAEVQHIWQEHQRGYSNNAATLWPILKAF